MLEGPFHADFYDGVLFVRGAVETEDVDQLRDLIQTHSSNHTRPVIVDLCEVDYLPSVAVGVIAKAMGAAKWGEGSIVIRVREGCPAQRVLAISALPYETVDDGGSSANGSATG